MLADNRCSRDNLMQMDPALLRAVIRERTHHTLEHPLYPIIAGSMEPPSDLGASVRLMLDVWEKRGLDGNLPDILWAKTLVKMADQVASGKMPEVDGQRPRRFSETEEKTVEELIFRRRSIRHWTQENVPEWIICRVIEAGLWAPHACNLQTVRFAVFDHRSDPRLLQCAEFSGHRAKIVVLQDIRAYEFFQASVPEKNRLMDCGAAVQNMLLMAHSLGLGAVWSTFTPREIEMVNEWLNLPDHIVPRTYVALGWPAQSVLPPAKIRVEDAVLSWPGKLENAEGQL